LIDDDICERKEDKDFIKDEDEDEEKHKYHHVSPSSSSSYLLHHEGPHGKPLDFLDPRSQVASQHVFHSVQFFSPDGREEHFRPVPLVVRRLAFSSIDLGVSARDEI
tara:strand:- start:79 stop:399 length:321 start_codon:yes stop_codon:yes gene_type:complete